MKTMKRDLKDYQFPGGCKADVTMTIIDGAEYMVAAEVAKGLPGLSATWVRDRADDGWLDALEIPGTTANKRSRRVYIPRMEAARLAEAVAVWKLRKEWHKQQPGTLARRIDLAQVADRFPPRKPKPPTNNSNTATVPRKPMTHLFELQTTKAKPAVTTEPEQSPARKLGTARISYKAATTIVSHLRNMNGYTRMDLEILGARMIAFHASFFAVYADQISNGRQKDHEPESEYMCRLGRCFEDLGQALQEKRCQNR